MFSFLDLVIQEQRSDVLQAWRCCGGLADFPLGGGSSSHDRRTLIRYEQWGRWMDPFQSVSAFRKFMDLTVFENPDQTRGDRLYRLIRGISWWLGTPIDLHVRGGTHTHTHARTGK